MRDHRHPIRRCRPTAPCRPAARAFVSAARPRACRPWVRRNVQPPSVASSSGNRALKKASGEPERMTVSLTMVAPAHGLGALGRRVHGAVCVLG